MYWAATTPQTMVDGSTVPISRQTAAKNTHDQAATRQTSPAVLSRRSRVLPVNNRVITMPPKATRQVAMIRHVST